MWIQHESFNVFTYVNDIGLVFLPVNVHRSSNIAIGYLYLNDPEDSTVFGLSFLNQDGDIAGWGQTAQTASDSPTLKKATTKIASLTDCQTQHTDAASKQICTRSPTTNIKNSCPDDEGSLLVIGNYLVGVFSQGGNECSASEYQVYTAIYPYYAWITNKLKIANDGGKW
jgi:secreted trypsin-like serine protease